jgi:uncharacterized protein
MTNLPGIGRERRYFWRTRSGRSRRALKEATMTNPFVWFHNGSEKPEEAVKFYQELLGWKGSESAQGLSVFSGATGPFAGVAAKEGASQGWIPYVEVEDVNRATERATQLGGKVVQKRTRGPAGEFILVRDPGGATLALWQKAA